MIEPKYIELIHRELDGENSPRESAALRAYLAQHEEARRLHDELAAASRILSAVQEVEPPDNLKKRILNAIRPDRYAARKNATVGRSIKNLIDGVLGSPNDRLKYAYVFTFGVLAGAAMLAVLTNSFSENKLTNISDFYGTIGQSPTSSRLVDAGRMEIDLPEVSGSITARYSTERVLTEVIVHPHRDVNLVLEFEESLLAFHSFTRLKGEGGIAVNATAGTLRLANLSDGGFVLVFNRKNATTAAAVKCKLISGDNLLDEGSFTVTGSDQ